ncbi:hypothetical protein BaRGS_00013985, partial [Batillaria attramentaria]
PELLRVVILWRANRYSQNSEKKSGKVGAEKVERGFVTGDLRKAWRGLKSMAGVQQKTSAAGPYCEDAAELSEQLNSHFSRFEVDVSREVAAVMEELQTLPDKHLVPEIEEEEVKMVFRHLQPRLKSF